jgi:hypothetical protein
MYPRFNLRCHSTAKKSVVKINQPKYTFKNSYILRGYHESVIEYYEKPRNLGSFAKNYSTIGTGFVGDAANTNVMKLKSKTNENTMKQPTKITKKVILYRYFTVKIKQLLIDYIRT